MLWDITSGDFHGGITSGIMYFMGFLCFMGFNGDEYCGLMGLYRMCFVMDYEWDIPGLVNVDIVIEHGHL